MSSTGSLEKALNAIAKRLFGDTASATGLARLSGGASQETWAFSVEFRPAESRSLILRRAPGGAADARSPSAIRLETEAALIEAASACGVPTPDIIYVSQKDDGLGEGFLMSRVAGETIARKLLRDPSFETARARLTAQCGAALARIHALPLAELPRLPQSDGSAQLAQYEETYRSFDAPRPVFELAIRWLRDNPPEPAALGLVHGDFRLGNLMVDQEGLAAVLDWELAHIGDPREDLAWICINSWRFGRSDRRVGGFGDLPDFLAAYADAGGAAVAPADIDWWELLGTLKWGVMCMIMYGAFRSGADPSVERAAIGRRVSETEIDILNLLEAIDRA